MILADHEYEDIARRFAVLSDPTRLVILAYLIEAGEASPTEVAEAVGRGRTNVSHHLARLLQAGMVGRRRDGQTSQYRVIDEMLRPLCEMVCSGLREQTGATGTRLQSVGP